MPSLSRWLNALNVTEPASSAEASGSKLIPVEGSKSGTTTEYFLAPFASTGLPPGAPLLFAVPPPNSAQSQPPGSLHFGFTHPSPSYSAAVAFFLECIPDPIGFLAHSAAFIRSRLGTSSAGPTKWRHPQLHLILEDAPGLAYTSGGMIHVSLQWIANIMREVQNEGRDTASAMKEFKGVLMHELVHAIQYDGHGSTPVWLTESIADYVRLSAQLGPPHWRHPGQGKKERGWEDGYDAGAQFLAWLVGPSGAINHVVNPDSAVPLPTQKPTKSDDTPPPQSTQYPTDPQPPAPAPRAKLDRPRPGPWPDFVQRLNASLEHGRYTQQCWDDLTGQRGGVEELWASYTGHYE